MTTVYEDAAAAEAAGVVEACTDGKPLQLMKALGSEADDVAACFREHALADSEGEETCPPIAATRLSAALPPFAAWRRDGDLLAHVDSKADAAAVLVAAAGSSVAGEDAFGALCFTYLVRSRALRRTPSRHAA